MERDNSNERDGMNTSGRTGGPHGADVRASDVDRDATAKILRQHYAEGRLDGQEFNERIDHCYAAKYVGELKVLTSDLPREEAPKPAPEPASDSYRRYRGRPPGWKLAVVLPIVVALIVISALTGTHLFFLAWPLFFFFFFRPFGRFGCGRPFGRTVHTSQGQNMQ